VGDYGGGVRVGRPFGARRFSPVRGLEQSSIKSKTSNVHTFINHHPDRVVAEWVDGWAGGR